MPDSPRTLRIRSLEAQVLSLLARVEVLEARVQALDSAGFELVGTSGSAGSPGYSSASVSVAGGKNAPRPSAPSGPERDQILRRVAEWLIRSLNEEHRGTSGRDSLAGPSRYYLIARDFSGKRFDRLKVVSPWSAAEPIVKRGSHPGESVFVGLPRWEDVVRVAELSGFTLESQDGR